MTEAEGPGRQQLETLLNLMPTPAALVEPGTERVLFANAAARESANGRLPLDEVARRAAGGEPVRGLEVTMQTADGARRLLVDAEPVPEALGAVPALIVWFRDVT